MFKKLVRYFQTPLFEGASLCKRMRLRRLRLLSSHLRGKIISVPTLLLYNYFFFDIQTCWNCIQLEVLNRKLMIIFIVFELGMFIFYIVSQIISNFIYVMFS